MLLTGALQNCQQVPCESAVPSARACKRAGSWFCWITPPWLCRARGAVKSCCSGCVDGEGSWGVEGCAVLLLLVCGHSGAALGWRRVHGPENLSPVWYCWACPLPSPIQTLLPSSPRGPGVSDWCHLVFLNHLQLGNKAFFSPVASSSQGCMEHMASGQSSCLAGAMQPGLLAGVLGVSLSCWGYRWVQFWG